MIDATNAATVENLTKGPRGAPLILPELGTARNPPKKETGQPQKSEFTGSSLGPSTSKEVEFGFDHMDLLTNFMVKHIDRLNKMQTDLQNLPPGENPLLLAQHSHEKELLEKLSTKDGKADQESIRKYLATDKGKGVAVLLLEEVAWKALAARNISAEMRGQKAAGRQDHLHTNFDRGILQNWFDHNRALLAGLGYTALYTPPVAALYAIFNSAAKEGVTFGITNIQGSTELLRHLLLKDPQEQRYWQLAYGIDMVNQTFTINEAKQDEEILDMMYTRFRILNEVYKMPPGEIRELPTFMVEGYRRVGIPNRLPFPFFREEWRTEDQGETETTQWRADVMNRMLRIAEVEGAPINDYVNIERSFRASREILMEYHKAVWDELKDEPTRAARIEEGLTKVKARIKALGSDATDDEKKSLDERLRRLSQARDNLDRINNGETGRAAGQENGLIAERGVFDAYQQALDNLNTLRARARDPAMFGTDNLEVINTRLQRTPDQQLGTLKTQLQQAETDIVNLRSTIEQIQTDFITGRELFERYTRAIGAGGLGMTQNQLATSDFDDLERIANLNAANAWAANANHLTDNRMNLIMAIGEAKAREASGDVAPNIARELDQVLAVGGLVREEELWTMTPNQLRQLFITRGIAYPGALVAGDMDAVIAQAQNRLRARQNGLLRAIGDEQQRVESHNRRVEPQRTATTRRRERLEGIRDEIAKEEGILTAIRNDVGSLATEFFNTREGDFRSALADVALMATTYPDLEIDNLRGVPYAEILNRIHLAPGGWPAGDPRDTDDNTRRMIISAMAEANARGAQPGVFTETAITGRIQLPPAAGGLAIPEDRVRRLNSYVELAQLMFENGANPAEVDLTNAGIQNGLRDAFNRIRSRYDLRQRFLANSIRSAPDTTQSFARLVNETYQTTERELTANRTAAAGYLVGGVNPTIANINSRVDQLNQELLNFQNFESLATDTGPLKPIRDRIKSFRTKREALLDTRVTAGYETIAAIDQEIANRQNDAQVQLRNNLQAAEEAVNSAQELVRNTDRLLERLVQNFDTVLGIDASLPAANRVGITDVALRTMTVEQILDLINQAYERGRGLGMPTPPGWPPAGNNNYENRMQIARAMIEARARLANPTIAPDPANNLERAVRIGIPENVFRVSTVEEAARELNQFGGDAIFGLARRNLDPADLLDRAVIEAIMDRANERYTVRRTAVNNMVLENQTRVRNMNETLGLEMNSLVVLRDFLTRSSAILEDAPEMIRRIGEFTNVISMAAPAIADQYTAQERASLYSAGMSEIYQLFLQYRAKDNRGEYYGWMIAPNGALAPRVILDSYNTSLGLGLAAGFNIADFLTALRNQYDQGYLTPQRLRDANRDLLDNRARVALTL